MRGCCYFFFLSEEQQPFFLVSAFGGSAFGAALGAGFFSAMLPPQFGFLVAIHAGERSPRIVSTIILTLRFSLSSEFFHASKFATITRYKLNKDRFF